MFYDRFEQLCTQKGVKPGRACSDMGFSRSLAAKWKSTGTEKPSTEALEQMAVYFDMPIEEILNGSAAEKQKAPSGEDDAPIMKIYNALNDRGREELERYGNYLQAQDVYRREEGKQKIEYIRHYLVPAAAGYASPIEGEDYELIEKDRKAPHGADYDATKNKTGGDCLRFYSLRCVSDSKRGLCCSFGVFGKLALPRFIFGRPAETVRFERCARVCVGDVVKNDLQSVKLHIAHDLAAVKRCPAVAAVFLRGLLSLVVFLQPLLRGFKLASDARQVVRRERATIHFKRRSAPSAVKHVFTV